MRGLLALGSLASLVALLAPAAGAQGAQAADVVLQVDPPRAPVIPEAETPAMAATVTVSCPQLLRSVDPADARAPVRAVVTWSAQDGIVVTGPESIDFDPQQCAAGAGATAVSKVGVFQLSVPRAAPGLQPLPVVASAAVGDARSADVPFTVTADYVTVSELKLERKLLQCSPCRDVKVPLEVTNLGNARTQYTFLATAQPSKGWSLRLPDVLLLDRGATGTAVATVSGHGGEGAFAISVVPTAADAPEKAGNTLTANVLVRDTSLVSRATPGPAPLLAGLAALGVALSRRRA